MNAKMFTYLLVSGAVLGFAQDAPPKGPDVGPDLTTSVTASTTQSTTEQSSAEDNVPRKRRKELRIDRNGPGRRVHIEERDENGDIIREFNSEGAPGGFEKRVEPFNNDGGEVRIERRINRNGPVEDQDVIVRRGPRGGMRAEARAGRGPEGPFMLPFPGGGELNKERAEHLEQAIRHLHEAGMDPLADRLQTRLDNFHAERREPQADARLQEEIARLKQEHQKLQQELRKLQRELNKPERKEKAKEKEKPAAE